MNYRTIAICIVIIGVVAFLFRDLLVPPPATAYLPLDNVTEGPIISINFDDGYESAFDIGTPIVEEAGFKSTYYIPINRLGEPTYMREKDVRNLQSRGHEIGAHSRTHTILDQMSLRDAREEVFGSKEDLHDMGIVRVSTFSYPDGVFNKDIIELVREAGFVGARLTNPGLNDRVTDPYQLLYLGMNSEISFDTVREKIDEAVREKKWLIMVFHKIDQDGFENVTSELLQEVVNYIKEKDVAVVTNAQGLYIMKNIPR